MALENDTQAPDFELLNQHGQPVRLSDFRGRKAVALVFFPLAFSGTCTGELCAVRDNLADFQNDDVQILGISTDHPYALKAWSESQGFDFPLLSDFWPHGEVAKAYGVFLEKRGMAVRGTFLIDKAGIVQFAEVNSPGEARDQNGWREAVAALAA